MAAVTLPVMVVALVQWDAPRDEAKSTERRARDLQAVIRALEVTETRSEEFARERESLAEKLDVLYAITPKSPHLAELVSRIEAPAGEYGIRVLDWPALRGARAARRDAGGSGRLPVEAEEARRARPGDREGAPGMAGSADRRRAGASFRGPAAADQEA